MSTARFLLDLFQNKECWRIDSWQIATDTLIVIIEAHSQIFS